VAVAAVLLLAITAFVLFERGGDEEAGDGETRATEVEPEVVDRPAVLPEPDADLSPVEGTGAPAEPAPAPPPEPAPVDRTVEERPERRGTEPGGAAAPGPAPQECARLLERASLGERLTEDEESFLRRRCRNGGGMP